MSGTAKLSLLPFLRHHWQQVVDLIKKVLGILHISPSRVLDQIYAVIRDEHISAVLFHYSSVS